MPSPEKSLDEKLRRLERFCKSSGMKLTHQRLEVFRELALATDHPSAEILHRRLQLRLPTLSLDTVYRTLATLEEHDLVARIQTTESQARFEVQEQIHHHLICDSCKKIVDFHWPDFDRIPLPEELSSWGAITHRKAILHGRCRHCS
ncbi:MAG: transcriptional repressor [Deltaproteobacteria bacterium]|nr:transcriptional repressor [Deltaproteobacteria bacterium]